MIACIDHGAILDVDMTGNQLRRWDADSKGRKFDGSINNIVVTATGGAYTTVLGPNTSTSWQIKGPPQAGRPFEPSRWESQEKNLRSRR